MSNRSVWGSVRIIVLTVVGSTVLLIGVAALVLPGPGILLMLLGLSILALEFAWAKRLLQKSRDAVSRAKRKEPRTPQT